MDVDSYLASPDYDRGLTATRLVWSEPVTGATAGALIFLLYLSLPALVAVRSGSGLPARSPLDGEHERAFLMNITGCTERDSWGGGIRNRRVRRQAQLLAQRHIGFDGMRSEYLDFVGTVITLAPLEVRRAFDAAVQDECELDYWHYMSHAASLLSSNIGDELTARDRCLRFIDAHSAPSAEGGRLYESLRMNHPQYVERAITLLPSRARLTVDSLMAGAI